MRNAVSRLTKCDTAAIVLGVLLFVYFAVTARYSIAMLDEAAYWLLGNRLSFGDRLITDEWHLIQFSALIDVPFYLLYVRIVGSTQGLILFTRYAFIVFDALFYCFMYRKLRRFNAAGLIGTFLFCAMIPELFFAFSYCTISSFAMMALLLILFVDEKRKSPAGLIFSGVLLAVAVLEDPFLLLAYVVWVLFAAVYAAANRSPEKKRLAHAAFLLEARTILLTTLGSVFVLIAFAAVLLLNGAFDEIGTVLPYLFTGEEYNGGNLIDPDQLMQAVRYFNVVPVIGLCCCAVAAAAVRGFRCKNKTVRFSLFLLSCAFFAACCIHAAVKTAMSGDIMNLTRFCQAHNVPLLLFAPVPFLLSEKNDVRRTCALIAGYLYSLLMDIPSKSFIGTGGFIVRSFLVLQLAVFLPEFLPGAADKAPAEKRPQKKTVKAHLRTGALAAAAVCLSVCALWEVAYIGAEGLYKPPEKLFLRSEMPLDHTLSKGPLKGLVTTREFAGIYDATLRDMDVIRQEPDCAVAMLDTIAFPYLYLQRKFATFTMSYAGELDRLIAYWKLPFATQPDYLYLPYYNPFMMFRYDSSYLTSVLSDVRSRVDCDVSRGEAGYIIHVRAVL